MAKILVTGFVVGMIETNVWFLHRSDSTDTILVDPADHGREVFEEVTALNVHNKKAQEGEPRLQIRVVLLTHAHFDHIGGLADLLSCCPVPVLANEAEKRLCQDTEANLSASYGRPTTVQPDVWLHDGEVFERCGIRLRMIATPGHTEGSCCYYIEGRHSEEERQNENEDDAFDDAPILIAGDTLFKDSVGRDDMPTGSQTALLDSLTQKLFRLPDDTRVYPGHGPCTTILHEKMNYQITE